MTKTITVDRGYDGFGSQFYASTPFPSKWQSQFKNIIGII